MPRAIFTVYLILWPVFTFNLTVSDLLRAPFTTWGWVGSAWCGLKCDFRITGESDTNGMDRDGGAAWWAYQSVLRLLRGLSRRQARLHRPFPMAICLCPLSFPILAPPPLFFFSSLPPPRLRLLILDSQPCSICYFFWFSAFSTPPPQHSCFPLFQVFPPANKLL